MLLEYDFLCRSFLNVSCLVFNWRGDRTVGVAMNGGLNCPGKTINSPYTYYRKVIEEKTFDSGL